MMQLMSQILYTIAAKFLAIMRSFLYLPEASVVLKEVQFYFVTFFPLSRNRMIGKMPNVTFIM
jgi:hypothetical protein